MSGFKEELQDLINKHCKENESNTPDFILANYIQGCMINYTDTIKRRDTWFGFEPFKNIEKIGELKSGR